MTTLTDDFACEVLSVVAEIPEGRVATYGQIARLVGKEKNARLVAKILSRAEYYGHFPCHRVVNHAGRLAPHWPEQAFLLFREGVDLKPDGSTIRSHTPLREQMSLKRSNGRIKRGFSPSMSPHNRQVPAATSA